MKFEKFPLFLFDFKLEDRKIIIDILNELLDKIYARAQNNDCIVHFVDPRTENDTYGFLRMIMPFLNIFILVKLAGISYLKLSQEFIS